MELKRNFVFAIVFLSTFVVKQSIFAAETSQIILNAHERTLHNEDNVVGSEAKHGQSIQTKSISSAESTEDKGPVIQSTSAETLNKFGSSNEVASNIEINAALRSLLANPIDLEKYKKQWGPSNSGAAEQSVVYFTPNYDGFYYRYMLFRKLRFAIKPRVSEGVLFSKFVITVYKKGTEVGLFNDSNEELIALKCGINNPTLGELNWFGKSRAELVHQYGNPQHIQGNHLIFSHDSKAISAHLEKGRVSWIKYVHLKSDIDPNEKLPQELVEF